MENARKLLKFIDNSPTPFHAVSNASHLLENAGFRKIKETDTWASSHNNGLKKGGKYYFTRNQSTLCAFVVPFGFKSGNGFNIVATHTDSPCLKLKPISKNEGSGCLKVGVETYGGGLWYTWFDRDLSIAGRVFIENDNGELESKLIHIDEPILRIPSLCIHLNREVNEKFAFNNETHLIPIMSTKFMSDNGPKPGEEESFNGVNSHHYALQNLIAEKLQIKPKNIKTYEISLCDHQKGEIGGIFNEFIFSPRLDNLFSTYCAVDSLVSESSNESVENETNIRLIALFDHEEVGSCSVSGADSTLMLDTVRRISLSFSEEGEIDSVERAIRNSFVISADMSHAVHPSYSEKHEANHGPQMHKGISIKQNSNQRYATSGWTGTIIRQIAQRNNIPYQEYLVRNDSACGSTIGPILSSKGFRTVDVGAPQLSMHSIREMAGTSDVDNTINLFRAFYREFTNLDSTLIID